MSRKIAATEVETLVALLSRLPGLGPRSARRAALHLIERREQLMAPLTRALADVAQKISICKCCGNIDTIQPCSICCDERRDNSLVCVVETVGDLWALERARVIKAKYHVLGGVLSPLDGIGPESLNFASLFQRVKTSPVREVLLALNATVEGQSTAYYILSELETSGVTVSRLAHGVPVGGELDYLDEGTLAAAVKARGTF